MNNTFLLTFAVSVIGGLGALAYLLGLVGLVWRPHRALARQLLLTATPGGLLGMGGLYGVASLTSTSPPGEAALIAFFCGAGVATLAWAILRWTLRQEAPKRSEDN